MPDTYTSQFSGEEIDSAVRAAQIISGASTPAELRDKLEIRGDTIPVSAEDSTLISEALTKIPTTSGGGVNPNLLDNWYFGRPVNQRGQTSYSTEWGYTIDRWQTSTDSSLTVNNGSISLTGGYVFEPLEEIVDALKGKTVTASLLFATGELEFAIGVVPTTWGEWDAIASNNHVGLQGIGKDSKRLWFLIRDNAKNILAVKLELGDTQTLAHKENEKWVLNEIPDFGEQLRRCQRYCQVLGYQDFSSFSHAYGSNAVYVAIPLPVTLRTVPTISDPTKFAVVTGGYASENVPVTGVSSVSTVNGFLTFFAFVAGGLTENNNYPIKINGSVVVSADL